MKKMAKKKRIIKNGYVAVVEDHLLEKATVVDYVYEHRLVAEEILDRPLKEGEEVHHLDGNKTNNSPDNILVLSGPMHAKLHTWLNKNTIIPKESYLERMNKGCIRCHVCEKPINPNEKYCSPVCQNIGRRTVERPSDEVLKEEIKTTSYTQLGLKYGVSGNTVSKWSKKIT
jgi:hypothetical protein